MWLVIIQYNNSLDVLNHAHNTGNLEIGSALTFNGYSENNVVYGNYNAGIYFVFGNESELPLNGYYGYTITLNTSLVVPIIKLLFFSNGYCYIMSQQPNGEVIVPWNRFSPN